MRILLPTALCAAILLAGCGEEPAAQAPVMPAAITADAVGHYCGMNLSDHPGPKGQVHLAGQSAPVWMSSVRDTFAFLMLPEESKAVAGVFVSDMGRASGPEAADPDGWVDAEQAWYVTGADTPAAAGTSELYPFANEAAAVAFASAHGGSVRRFAEITEDEILNAEPADGSPAPDAGAGNPHGAHGGGHGY